MRGLKSLVEMRGGINASTISGTLRRLVLWYAILTSMNGLSILTDIQGRSMSCHSLGITPRVSLRPIPQLAIHVEFHALNSTQLTSMPLRPNHKYRNLLRLCRPPCTVAESPRTRYFPRRYRPGRYDDPSQCLICRPGVYRRAQEPQTAGTI